VYVGLLQISLGHWVTLILITHINLLPLTQTLTTLGLDVFPFPVCIMYTLEKERKERGMFKLVLSM
jgi:hypothetical protein